AGRSARQANTVLEVPRDNVAGADRVTGRLFDEHALQHVPQRGIAGDVQADDIALYQVGLHVGGVQVDAAEVVAGDEVARARRGAADRVVRRAAVDEDALEAVATIERAGHVGTEVVAFDEVGRRRAEQVDTVVVIAG